eukprot:GHVT01039715.1.p2 GENE.GHVT01039715.1~~GHVT01039715.1.p2  ORF type:complete len:108 (-),score=20.41 GHVT01039715.1:232-555(-)
MWQIWPRQTERQKTPTSAPPSWTARGGRRPNSERGPSDREAAVVLRSSAGQTAGAMTAPTLQPRKHLRRLLHPTHQGSGARRYPGEAPVPEYTYESDPNRKGQEEGQ